MKVRSGVTSSTPENVFIDAGAVYFNYGLADERLLGATRGGNEFNTNRVLKNIEADGIKGRVKGMERVTEVNPQITVNMLELSIDNLIKAISGANQSDRITIPTEHILGVAQAEFDLDQNDIVENSERVYVKRPDGVEGTGAMVLQNRSKKYSSRFVGDNAADNKGFGTGIGDWVTDAEYEDPAMTTGGYTGNCLIFTGKDVQSETDILSLLGANGAVLTNLVVGQYYRLQIIVKKGGTWGAGVVTMTCDNGSKAMTLAADWTTYVITFLASGTDATIILNSATAPVTADTMYIDSLELERVDYPTAAQIIAGQVGYVVKLDGGEAAGAKGSIIFMSALDASPDDEIIVNYTYVPATASDAVDTTITGGEISDTDYIDNVAIVGNVSGKNYPVICIVENALADGPFSLSTAPRDEAVPSIVFTGHYDPSDLDTEPWEIRYPKT